MKKLVSLLLSTCVLLCIVVGLTACGGDEECQHSYSKNVTPATCTEQGYTTYTCDLCHDTYVDDYVEAPGHSYGEWIAEVSSTCSKAGTLGHYHCSACGKDFDADKNPLASLEIPTSHSFGEWIAEVSSTCSQAGTLGHYHCSLCDRNFDASKNLLASLEVPSSHSYGEWITEVSSTCSEAGALGHYHCSACGKDFDTDKNELTSIVIPAKEHQYVNGMCSCGAPEPSEGLVYELNSDKISYSVIGIGTCTDETIVIPSKHLDLPVTRIAASAFEDESDFISVFIPASIKIIDSDAFNGCEMTSVTFGKGSQLTTIGANAFEFCSELENINIPDSVTDILTEAFRRCDKLTSVTFGEKSQLTTIGASAFEGCYKLANITIPGNVKYIQVSAFDNCEELTSIIIPNGVISIGHEAFKYSGLTSITIADSVTEIGGEVFEGTPYYEDESNWEDGVLYIGKHLIVAKKDITGDYSIKQGTIYVGDFSACTGLTGITIPDGVTTIGPGAFMNCTSLTSITISNSVTTIGSSSFYGCKILASITIPDSVTIIEDMAFYDCEDLTSIVFGENSQLISIGSLAFAGCNTLTSITIPEKVTQIGSGAFYDCFDLTSITIPSGVKNIPNDTFYRCNDLANVYYMGTAAEWDSISINSNNNSDLTDAKRYYYIQNEEDIPADGGNYWHYVNGVPTVWTTE